MRKVIIKAKLSSRDRFEDKLSDIDLDFSPIYWQHDRIYIPRDYKRNSNYPRLIMRTEIRSVDKPPKYSLILKRHIEDSGVDVVEETTIKDYESPNFSFSISITSFSSRYITSLNESHCSLLRLSVCSFASCVLCCIN